ncbi:uncharacterized protein LOC134769716 [Penaeus indicus]|uniref:uncharacterized protein LOC134769716 n=1 Tax=Penaeus indicus TaxID=29960 RepID=UPI00300DAEEE
MPVQTDGPEDYKANYKTLKRKLKLLIYENECFQEELRKAQRALLRVRRDKSFLLDRLLQYHRGPDSSSDSEQTEESDTENDAKLDTKSCRKRLSLEGSGGGSNSSQGQKELIEKLAKLDLEMLEVKNEIQNVKLDESRVESKQDYTRRYVEYHLKTLPHHKHIVSESKDEVLVNQTDESSCSGRTEEKNAIQQLAEILCARQISDSLPRPEPEVFKGDILQYSMWVKSFDTLIESKTKVAAERMYYLSKYTDGEAKEVISGLLLLDSTEAYSKARKLLKQRFGNAFVIANAYREKLHEWPRIPLNDGPALMKFSDFLETCKTAMSNIQYLNILNDPKENQRMLQKLPHPIVERWNTIVDRELYKASELDDESDDGLLYSAEFPSFTKFCIFVRKEASKACNPITSITAVQDKGVRGNITVNAQKQKSRLVKSFVTETNEVNDKISNNRFTCPFCSQLHNLNNCNKFSDLDLKNKRNFVNKNKLCRGCLKRGHILRFCRQRSKCKTCNKLHPTSLHDEALVQKDRWESENKVQVKEQDKEANVSNTIKVNKSIAMDVNSMIVPVWLHHKSDEQKKVLVYALLDDQSDVCFIKNSALGNLGIGGIKVHLRLATMNGEQTVTCSKSCGLIVKGVYENRDIPLPHTYSREVIPCRRDQIPRPETAREWPHLERIVEKLMPYSDDVEVGLLIGLNCIKAIKPKEIITGNDNDPYAKRTDLGWGIVGKVRGVDSKEVDVVSVHRTMMQEVIINHEKKCCLFTVPTKVKEIINPEQVKKMFELDFNDVNDDCPISQDDKMFIKGMREGIHQVERGHYEMPLPLKNIDFKFLNNRDVILHRLMNLKRKFRQKKDYYEDYVKFMKDLIEKGYAEPIPKEELSRDDWLMSVSTVAEAIDLIDKSKNLCKLAGFTLHKFSSNKKEVISAISPEVMSDNIKSLDLTKDTLPMERTLGIEWCIESDTFQFRVNFSSKPLTRRGILSTVSSIFDPLGLVSPLILLGKKILQDLCRGKVEWDDPVPDHIKPLWERWRNELCELQNLKLPRCYKPESFGEIKSVELHHFSDACQDGYGQCSYIRFVNVNDEIHCSLVMSKSRVTPLRAVTIPRLELTTAVVSSKVSVMLRKELDYQNIKEIFWTDSKAILGYISNDAKRFHVFVANRVQYIRDRTDPIQWNYVQSESNPADCAARGLCVKELMDNLMWWNGPKFLWKKLDYCGSSCEQRSIFEDDPEVKKVSFVVTSKKEESFLDRLDYFSDWFRAKRATALCLSLQSKYKKTTETSEEKIDKRNVTYSPVTVSELEKAEKVIIKELQSKYYADEKRVLQTKKVLNKRSSLYKLDPFMDIDGIMKVRGRLSQANLNEASRHPVILPGRCHYHHQGRGIT